MTQVMGLGNEPASIFLHASLGGTDVTFKMSKPSPVPRRAIKLLSYPILTYNIQERD